MSVIGSVASFFGDHLPVVLLIIVVLLISYYFLSPKNVRLPPGPKGIPWFGRVFTFDGNNKEVETWRRLYGDILYLRLNAHPTIVVSDIKHIRDVLGKHGHNVSDRPSDNMYLRYFDSKGGEWK